MQLGLLYQGLPPERPSATARWVESLGFDSLWVGDHVLSYVDGLAAAAAMGAATDRILLGTSVCILPFRHPVHLSRTLATLATEVGDRFVLGIGAGGDVPEEFAVLDVEMAGRGAVMDRAVAVVHRALDEGLVGDDLTFADRPPAAPPIWSGGRSPAACRRAAAVGDGFLPYLVTPERYAEMRDGIVAARVEAGRTGRFTWAVDVMASLDEDPDRAWASATAYAPYGLDDDRRRRYVTCGGADALVEALAGYAAVGVEHAVIHLAAPPEEKRRQVARLAEVVERVHALEPGGRP